MRIEKINELAADANEQPLKRAADIITSLENQLKSTQDRYNELVEYTMEVQGKYIRLLERKIKDIQP